MCVFGKLDYSVKNRLISSFCMNFYGSELWLLAHNRILDICTTWRKAIRRVWQLPFNTHCDLLPHLCQQLPLFDELCRRSINFLLSCYNSESVLVRSLFLHGLSHFMGRLLVGQNICFCLERYNCDLYAMLTAL